MEYRIPNHSVCLTTNKSNKFSVTVFGERLKQAKWQRNSDLNTVEQPVQPEMRKKKQKMTIFFILVIFLVKTFLMVMVLKICLFINEHLVRWI